MPTTRAYVIRRKDGTGSPRLVEASMPATALRHVAEETFDVDTPTPLEAIHLMQTGVKPEKAGHQQGDLLDDVTP